tara:strand:+ start:181 stop:531 length:351 start_codon:yes stop_codon:yes gene_type:complete
MGFASSTAFSLGDRTAVRRLLERIRAQRLARNWTQSEMARRAGMSRATYQNFEGGYGNPTLANLMRVLGILGVADRVADLVPEPEESQTLASLQRSAVRKGRQRARVRGGGAGGEA